MRELAGKHILLIVENEAVPFDRRMWNIARSLRDFGATVSVICPMFGQDSEKEVVLEGITIHRYRNAFSDGTVAGYLREYATAFVKTAVLLHKVARKRGRIDVVHVANPPDIFWPLGLYARLLGTKFVFDEHDLSPEAYLARFNRDEARGVLFSVQVCFQRLSYRFSNMIISTNESYKAKAVAVRPGYAGKTFVVRNGPDTRQFHRRDPNPALKRGRRYLAAYIGVMAVQDGVEYVIRAVDELVNRRSVRDLIVYLIGDGDDQPRLRKLAADLLLDDYLVFTGRIPDEPALEILSTADVFLAPDPPNPLNDLSTMTKVMEYMAMGKPIVSFDLKEARYSAGESALYVERNDPESFADGIVQILNEPVGSQRMGEFGVARVERELSWQKQSERLLDAYRFVLGKPAATVTDTTGNALGIKALFRALTNQIYRRSVAELYQRVPMLLSVHRPVIDRGDYQLRFTPTRFAIELYRHPDLPRDDEQFLGNFLSPGMTYVDVGANIGTTTLAAAQAVGATGRVIAFEPHPATFRDLTDNVALNPELASRITLVSSAVGESTGSAGISDLVANDVNHIDSAGIPVPMTTLDDALAGTPKIDLLKIDVEGYERNVLQGATRTLTKTDAVYFESCEENFGHFGYSVDDLFDLLATSGFTCYAVDPSDLSLAKVHKGRRCAQGYENLLARRESQTRQRKDALQSAGAGG